MKNQFLPAEVFFKSSIVEKNPDMSFREAVAKFFGVSPEEITRIRRAKDASGWDITIEDMNVEITKLLKLKNK